jgi:hypothetical protein
MFGYSRLLLPVLAISLWAQQAPPLPPAQWHDVRDFCPSRGKAGNGPSILLTGCRLRPRVVAAPGKHNVAAGRSIRPLFHSPHQNGKAGRKPRVQNGRITWPSMQWL